MESKYYFAEHEDAYERLAQRGLSQWNDLFEPTLGDEFSNRRFLDRALTELAIPAGATVWEYGCGTGPAARHLAERGLRVHAVDLIPRAIELARGFAAERELGIEFAVADVCELAEILPTASYDLVVDSYCLQSIVLDDDRRRVLTAVRNRLAANGYYLVSTSMYDPDRVYDDGFVYDERTGICRHHGQPHRRHLRPDALRQELVANGFRVLSQTGDTGGDVICALDD